MRVSELMAYLPQPVQIIVALFAILTIGVTVGKAASDYGWERPVIAELRAIRELQTQSLCVQVAQLRKTDWTYCLVPPDGNY